MAITPTVKIDVSGARGPAGPQGSIGPAGTVADASGFIGAVAISPSGYKPAIVRSTDAVAVAKIDVGESYSGTGTATEGAGRLFIGRLAPSGDDSAILIGRKIVGNLLFTHGARDESTFVSTGDSAYTAFDAAQTYQSNGSVKYNHGYAFQARPLMSASNGIDLFSSFVSFPRVSSGAVDRLYHFHVQGLNLSGGTVGQHVGLYISPISGGTGDDYAIYQESSANPNYLAGDTQFGGAVTGISTLAITGELKSSRAVHAFGTIATFNSAGGIAIAGQNGGAEYRTIYSYSDGSGTVSGLSIVSNNILLGGSVPVTGKTVEVFGVASADNLKLTSVPTYADDTAAGGGGLTAGDIYKTSVGVLMIKL